MELTTINPRVIFISEIEPEDKTKGKLWYNTLSNTLYVSDGTNYNLLETDITQLNYLLNEQALYILELQAEATISGGQSAYMIRDVYSDASGFLDTINTTLTDAFFDTNKYKYVQSKLTAVTENKTATSQTGSGAGPFTCNITAKADLIINQVKIDCSTTNADVFYCNIVQNGDILATKSAASNASGITFNFSTTDYLRPILNTQNFSVVWGRESGSSSVTYYLDGQSIDGNLLYMNNARMIGEDGSGTMGIYATGITTNTLRQVITEAQTIKEGITRFVIHTFDEQKTGDGNITYDVSFDNGENYQNVISDVETIITHTGTQLLIKENFNSPSKTGAVSSRGYAILFW